MVANEWSSYSLFIHVLLALIPANIAKQKGHNFVVWWLYGCSYLIVAIIHVQYIEDINTPKEISSKKIQSPFKDMEKLIYLKENGALTDEEYNNLKASCLKQM